MEELHKRYSTWRLEHPIAADPSFAELRGFASFNDRQRVDSLQSDFLGVAEHLHDNHPSITGRLTTCLFPTNHILECFAQGYIMGLSSCKVYPRSDLLYLISDRIGRSEEQANK